MTTTTHTARLSQEMIEALAALAVAINNNPADAHRLTSYGNFPEHLNDILEDFNL
jgi:hypothetical protein